MSRRRDNLKLNRRRLNLKPRGAARFCSIIARARGRYSATNGEPYPGLLPAASRALCRRALRHAGDAVDHAQPIMRDQRSLSPAIISNTGPVMCRRR
jgi:hypothetical protein